jgi:ABC-type proline/glycine betaine transport system ATPase subunit
MSKDKLSDYDPNKFPNVSPEEFYNLDLNETAPVEHVDYNELLSESESPDYESNLTQPRMSAKKVKACYYLGSRGSGKTTAMEIDAEKYHNAGLLVMWLWGSRSNENVFIGVNCNCQAKWNQGFEDLEKNIMLADTPQKRAKLQDVQFKLEKSLHCNCHKAYPVSWLVPNYYNFKGVKEYNYNWANRREFDIAFRNGDLTRSFEGLSRQEKIDLVNRQLPKPKHLVQTDTVRICPFTVPKGAKNKEIFEKEFIKYILEARKEHRWIVMNPLMFLDETDKFETMGFIMTGLKRWVDMYFQPNTPQSVAKLRNQKEPVPKDQWTKLEKSWDKICLVLAEIRTIAPPHKYSPEQKSNLSKRPIIDLIPELRHFRIWLLGDLQSPTDLNDSVAPMADNVIVKRANPELLGQEWNAFVTKIDKTRKERLIALSHGKFEEFKNAPMEYKNAIDRDLPRVSEIPKNKGYVVYQNGEYYLTKFESASFHHKKETETIQSVTEINWSITEEKATSISTVTNISTDESMTSKKMQKKEEEKVLLFAVKEYLQLGDNASWDKVLEKIQEKILSDDPKEKLPKTGIELMSKKILSNKIRKIKEYAEMLDAAKKRRSV